jgi:hypothetical protein
VYPSACGYASWTFHITLSWTYIFGSSQQGKQCIINICPVFWFACLFVWWRLTPLSSNISVISWTVSFANLFSITFLYFFTISSLVSYFNLFLSIFIQSYGYTTTYAMSVYHHWFCEFESRSYLSCILICLFVCLMAFNATF